MTIFGFHESFRGISFWAPRTQHIYVVLAILESTKAFVESHFELNVHILTLFWPFLDSTKDVVESQFGFLDSTKSFVESHFGLRGHIFTLFRRFWGPRKLSWYLRFFLSMNVNILYQVSLSTITIIKYQSYVILLQTQLSARRRQ